MFFSTKAEVEYLTPLWKGERLADGRPKVPDSVLARMRKLTMEEMWAVGWENNYEFQVEGDFRTTHSTETRLVGRALTIECAPFREDLHLVCKAESQAFGFQGNYNKSAVDRLVEGDVMVVDFFDKVEYGTYFGGNLSTQVSEKTKGGGAVIWGGIRDLDQVRQIPNVQIYYRGSHPTAIRDYVMTGYNRPTRIGRAMCMPGDVVFGSGEGIVFVPAHLAEETVTAAEISHVKDVFGFLRLRGGVYNATEIDNQWTDAMWKDFLDWFASAPETAEYRYLDFDKVIADQKEGVNKRRNRARNGLPYNP